MTVALSARLQTRQRAQCVVRRTAALSSRAALGRRSASASATRACSAALLAARSSALTACDSAAHSMGSVERLCKLPHSYNGMGAWRSRDGKHNTWTPQAFTWPRTTCYCNCSSQGYLRFAVHRPIYLRSIPLSRTRTALHAGRHAHPVLPHVHAHAAPPARSSSSAGTARARAGARPRPAPRRPLPSARPHGTPPTPSSPVAP